MRSSKASGAVPSSWWSRCASVAARAPPAFSRWRDMGVRELFELKGKVALVTGGLRGLGVQISPALGEMGARIGISAGNAAETEKTKAQVGKRGVECRTWG